MQFKYQGRNVTPIIVERLQLTVTSLRENITLKTYCIDQAIQLTTEVLELVVTTGRCSIIRLTICRFEEGGKFDHDRTVYGSQ